MKWLVDNSCMNEKTICCIGDSLTEGDYGILGKSGIANVKEKNYPYFLSKLVEHRVLNYGRSGYRSINILPLVEDGTFDVSCAKIIIIMLGTNGGQTPNGDSENDLAYKQIVNICQKNSDGAKIFLCTPPHVTTDPSKSNCGYYPNVKNAYDFVLGYAKECGLEVIDLFNDSHFRDDNENIMQPNDGLHFSEIGYKTLAEIIYVHIKKYI